MYTEAGAFPVAFVSLFKNNQKMPNGMDGRMCLERLLKSFIIWSEMEWNEMEIAYVLCIYVYAHGGSSGAWW